MEEPVQRPLARGTKPLGEIEIGRWIRPESPGQPGPKGEGEWFCLCAKYPKYITVVGESNQTMYINSKIGYPLGSLSNDSNRYSEVWEYRE